MDEGSAGSGFADFDRMGLLFRETRSLLDAALTTGDLPDGAADVITRHTLPHIEDVEAGFRWWLRASEAALSELRMLVLQGGLGMADARDPAEERAALIEQMQARSGAGGSRALTAAPTRRLAALNQARLVFALLPATAPADVRFPAPHRSYADIFPPRTPTELSMRIEELERELWRLAAGRRPTLGDSAYRRVYGYFDTGERLTASFLS
jgi:hypothetical protein